MHKGMVSEKWLNQLSSAIKVLAMTDAQLLYGPIFGRGHADLPSDVT